MNFVDWYLHGVYARELDCTLVISSRWICELLRVTGIGLLKFHCPSAKCCYMMLKLVCVVLWVQLGFLGCFLFYWDYEFILIYCMHSDTIFWTKVWLWDNLFPMSARDCNSRLHKQFMHCLEGVFVDNNERIVACARTPTSELLFSQYLFLITKLVLKK